MKIEIKNEFDVNSLNDIFNLVGWGYRDISKLNLALKNSWSWITIFDEEKLIGFCRIVADGAYFASIWDVVIHPDYQNKGFGKVLMSEALRIITEAGMIRVVLTCACDKVSFYEKLGFSHEKDNSISMLIKIT